MTYYLKFGKIFYNQLFWFSYAIIWIVKDSNRFSYWDLIFVFLGAITFPRLVILTYFKLLKKPVLIANDLYIFDCYKNIKYYWEDIDEIIATDDYLQITLCNPVKYLNKIGNPFFRLVAIVKYRFFKTKSLFSINLNILGIEKGKNKEFLDTLNDYSLAMPKVK